MSEGIHGDLWRLMIVKIRRLRVSEPASKPAASDKEPSAIVARRKLTKTGVISARSS